MQAACNRATGMHPFDFDASSMESQATRHVTGALVTTCEKLYRHLRQCRAFSIAEPVPRFEATLRMDQQCQPSTPVKGQSAVGEGATVDMARSGPTVMATTGERKRQSNRLQAHVPSWSSRRALSHGAKTTRPCSVPRTARACTTTAPRTARPVALTPRQGRRHLWQEKRRRFTSAIMTVSKKVRHIVQFRILFLFPFLSLATRTRKGDTPKGILLCEGSGPRALLLIRGSKAGPSEGFRQPPQSTRASRPVLVRGSKAGPSEGFDSRLRPLGLCAHY
jgi:hypothetical protein